MIKKIKRAAEFLGHGIAHNRSNGFYGIYLDGKSGNFIPLENFNPHEETGRHLLVEIERKLTEYQYIDYTAIMKMEYVKLNILAEIPFYWWFKTAPSELCFEKIMEVIPEVK